MKDRRSAPLFTFVPRQLKEALKDWARANRLSQSELIELAISHFLQQEPSLQQRQGRVKAVAPYLKRNRALERTIPVTKQPNTASNSQDVSP